MLSPQTLPAAQAMLQAHPDIDMFICIADEGCDGCLSAFKATHPSAARQKDMFICGFDGSGPTITQILEGTPVIATGTLDLAGTGAASVEATANAVEGKGPTKINYHYVLVDHKTQALGKKLLKECEDPSGLHQPGGVYLRVVGMTEGRVAVASTRPVTEAGPGPPEQIRRINYQALRRLGAAQGGGLCVARFRLGTYFTIVSPAFLTQSKTLVILLRVSIRGMVAVPGSMLLLSGKLDLSVGSVAGSGPRVSASRQDNRFSLRPFHCRGSCSRRAVGAHERRPRFLPEFTP